jgi:hypothetical protein
MKTTILVVAAICALVVVRFSIADAAPQTTTRYSVHTPRTVVDADIVVADRSRRDVLREYVLDVMQGWPAAKIETVPLEDVADSIANVAAADAPAWTDDDTGARSAVLLAALGYFEGARYAKYVDTGVCNRPDFRRLAIAKHGTCDGGLAHSIFQIHEIELVDPKEKADAVALSDRTFAAHIALRLARQSLASTGSLRNYTGEWSGACPKADERLKFADKAWRAHPYAP